MEELNIVDLIENNPITKLNGNNYQSKMVTKIKEKFSGFEQQMFVSSFYCFLNYNSKTDFVIDLDSVWKWMGFSQKDAAKRVLDKNFIVEHDYKVLVHQPVDQKKGRGGHNKEIIMLTVKTFKSICLKAGTKKADEIHEYFIKLEETLQEIIQEESTELKLQLEQKETELQNEKIKSMSEKSSLLRETLIAQFPINTQCIYIGTIDNKSLGKPNSKMYNEDLIKFGQTNNLGERDAVHTKTYSNFKLIAAFKVKNKIEIENAIKRHPLLQKRIRSVIIKDINYRELLALDEDQFTIEKIIEHIKQVIKENEYNVENYNLLLEKNYELEEQLRSLQKSNKEKDEEITKLKTDLKNYKPDTTDDSKNKICSSYALCKYGYYLYAFESSPLRYKCSMVRQKDYEFLQTNLKQIDSMGEMKYNVKVKYPFSEKVMSFILKSSLTMIGNNTYEGTFESIKRALDITLKLEDLLIKYSDDLEQLDNILDCKFVVSKNEEENPEVPQVRKAKRPIDQINKDTGEVINTYESIEAAGRSLGLTTGTAIGIALREKRVCKGFIWRYSGVSKEDQYADQPVVKVCCCTGEKVYFNTIADAAKDCNISAPGLRMRILTDVHVNKYHWIFDKNSTHYI
jgi:phage anti-repressor protein